MRAFILLLIMPLILAGCAAEPVWAPQEAVDRVRYSHPGPPEITLYTVINNGSDNGAHSSLMVNASERVIFDPAGTFGHRTIPERNDVIYGITPAIERVYVGYHARVTYRVLIQRITVSPEVAELALQRIKSNGAVQKSYCTRATSALLKSLPGFESIDVTWFPNNLAEDFAKLPGVRSTLITEDDPDDKALARTEYLPEASAALQSGGVAPLSQ